MEPLVALDRTGGVARWTELARLGVGRRRLLAAVRDGDVARPARGVFCRPELVSSLATQALCVPGQLTCLAGAEALGLEVFTRADRAHVRTPLNTRPSRRGVVAHPWGLARSGRVASIAAVLHDCALCLPEPEAVAVIDSALRLGRVERSDWPQVVAAGPYARAVARVLALANPEAQSVLESVGRVLLVLARLGEVVSQLWVEDVGWVDLVVDGWLVVELDGWEFHRQKFQEDRRRDAELSRRGYVVLRFTYADLASRRNWFLATVAETLDRGRPPFGIAQSQARER